MVDLKVGQWVYHESAIAERTYYVKIVSPSTGTGFTIGLNNHHEYRPHLSFNWKSQTEFFQKITLGHVLNFSSTLDNYQIRNCVKEILEWLSLELRPPQQDFFI